MAVLTDAVSSGDLRASLEALRDALAAEIETGSRCVKCGGGLSSSTAALAKQLRDTLAVLATIKVPEGSKTDDLRRKRAERQASVQARAARRQQRRPGGD